MSVRSIHQFAEKVALVSDAGSPVGRAVSMQLALQGSYVIGLFPEGGETAVNELVELGTLAHGLEIDPSRRDGAVSAADEVGRIFGRLDLLVNCLKFRPQSSFEDMTEPDFAAAVNRNLGAAFFLTQAVLGLMNPRPKPKIVNVTSAIGGGHEPLFEALQASIAGLTRSLAGELPEKFRVNCVEVFEAPETRESQNELMRDPTVVSPDDVARTILFLLSSESSSINGQVTKLGCSGT